MGAIPVVTGFILTDLGQTPPAFPKAGFACVGDEPLAHVGGFRRRFRNSRGWKLRPLETGSSTDLSIGTSWSAGFR